MIAAATMVANVLVYALFLVLNRALSPNDLGAVAALLNLTIISGVLALALQLVAARQVATAAAPASDGPRSRDGRPPSRARARRSPPGWCWGWSSPQ